MGGLFLAADKAALETAVSEEREKREVSVRQEQQARQSAISQERAARESAISDAIASERRSRESSVENLQQKFSTRGQFENHTYNKKQNLILSFEI